MIKAFLVSDAHISGPKSPRYGSFLKFLDYIYANNATHLFIIGDLFEFLYGDGKYAVKRYAELFGKLELLHKKGVSIHYLYGNHDFNFVLPLAFDFIHSDPRIDLMDIGGKKITIYHGDGLDPADYKYRFLKRVVRGRSFSVLTKLLPDPILYKLAELCSMLSRTFNSGRYKNPARAKPYRDYAVSLLEKTDADVVVFSHTHIPELFDVYVRGVKKYYLNTGFFGESRNYAVMDDKGVCLCVFDERC
ncbi:MAG: UDP-2,3-diacylglucosamine diphosphatase [Pseudomonadota bacterium]